VNNIEIVEKIKSGNWDNRVQRPGFLQSKHIVALALNQEIFFTRSVSVSQKSNFWVRSSAIYDQDVTDKLVAEIFPKAFKSEPFWAIGVCNELEKSIKKAKDLILVLGQTDWSKASVDEKNKNLKEYVDVLLEIQKYYAFAVPLTNFCEKVIRSHDESLLEFAVQYKPLDVDFMNQSLVELKNSNQKDFTVLADEHLKKYAWIKTNYNIIEPYTIEDVESELKSEISVFKPLQVPEVELRAYVTALQIGIFLRNRVKKVSQQIWFAYNTLAKQFSLDLNIATKDFYQLTYHEVLDSVKKGKISVSEKEIAERHNGFVVGVLEGEEILLTGDVVDKLFIYFNPKNIDNVDAFSGSVASRGFVKGVVRVITNIQNINKLEEGDILVTSMTTPDFIVAMKRAGAIVTDEGGLSCHAAIVSREMKKPCIIGTKIATKVLKDGDLVEVDAERGVVKRL
jgi:phosphohistidine swiveling domain-containing protein